jgi:hypothetical protein
MSNCLALDNRSDLETKLLSLGGLRIFIQHSPFLGEMLRRGQIFTAAGRLAVPGPSYQAHRPAVLHYVGHHFQDESRATSRW